MGLNILNTKFRDVGMFIDVLNSGILTCIPYKRRKVKTLWLNLSQVGPMKDKNRHLITNDRERTNMLNAFFSLQRMQEKVGQNSRVYITIG